ncbi:unnamed protein product [Calicophoron daubneyi]|uniref:Uncharacterized protein n=1 Tax=Calicophoron daubneyi TaxID=300641 RepID=A0AAV2TDY3_CALDB
MDRKHVHSIAVLSLLIAGLCSVVGFSDMGSPKLDEEYRKSLTNGLITPPLAFLPSCEPNELYIFSTAKIPCSCGLTCHFGCHNTRRANHENPVRVCRRVCNQRPCMRPSLFKVYKYKLFEGACHLSDVCTYKGRCDGKGLRRLRYGLLSCHPVNSLKELRT